MYDIRNLIEEMNFEELGLYMTLKNLLNSFPDGVDKQDLLTVCCEGVKKIKETADSLIEKGFIKEENNKYFIINKDI